MFRNAILSFLVLIFLGIQPSFAIGIANPADPVATTGIEKNNQHVIKVRRRGFRLPRTVPVVIPMTGGYKVDALTLLLFVVGIGVIGYNTVSKMSRPKDDDILKAYAERFQELEAEDPAIQRMSGNNKGETRSQSGQRGNKPTFGKRV